MVVHSASQRTFRYGELLGDVRRARDRLLQEAGREDINGERVAFLVENSYDYVGMSNQRSSEKCLDSQEDGMKLNPQTHPQ